MKRCPYVHGRHGASCGELHIALDMICVELHLLLHATVRRELMGHFDLGCDFVIHKLDLLVY